MLEIQLRHKLHIPCIYYSILYCVHLKMSKMLQKFLVIKEMFLVSTLVRWTEIFKPIMKVSLITKN